jgi:hypothetical protein
MKNAFLSGIATGLWMVAIIIAIQLLAGCSYTIPVGTYDYCVRLEVVDERPEDWPSNFYGTNQPIPRPKDFSPNYYRNIIADGWQNSDTAIHEETHAVEGVVFGNANRSHQVN